MGKVKKMVLIILAAILALYLACGLHLFFQVQRVLNRIRDNMPYDEAYNGFINEYFYERINTRITQPLPSQTEEYVFSPPVVLHNFFEATVKYDYTYELREGDKLITASTDIDVTLKFKRSGLNWEMVSYYEDP